MQLAVIGLVLALPVGLRVEKPSAKLLLLLVDRELELLHSLVDSLKVDKLAMVAAEVGVEDVEGSRGIKLARHCKRLEHPILHPITQWFLLSE